MVDRGYVTAGDGAKLYVEEHGDYGAPVTLVLVHGWTLDIGTWGRQIADVPDVLGAPVRILAYELRGHGRSAPVRPESASIATLGDDLAAVLAERVPTGRVVLAGHSMGGMTIMALAERHPALFAQRIGGVAFVSTSAGGLEEVTYGLPRSLAPLLRTGEHVGGRMLVRRRLPTTGAGSDTAGVAAGDGRAARPNARRASRPGIRWLLFGDNPVPAEVDRTAAAVAATPPESLVGYHTAFADHERRHALKLCADVPVLVAVGGKDRLCPPPHAREIARAVPDSRLLLYPGAGHILPLERADEITAHLARLTLSVQRGQGEKSFS